MAKRHGFTLIEVLIVLAILLVLAGIAYPMVADIGDLARPATMAGTVRQVREKIIYHTALGDCPISAEGYPASVQPSWFPAGRMPTDVWTEQPLWVQVVHGAKDAIRPNNETFVIKPDGKPAGHTAWYNAANGSFCAKVPKVGTEDEQRQLFRRVNGLRYADVGGGDDS
jgi:prepilin-type N-terminal cleavage/methylation domain-containing protein